MEETVRRLSLDNSASLTAPQLHPAGISSYLRIDDVAHMIQRTLNYVDTRLVDHGSRVAWVYDAVLEMSGAYAEMQRRTLYLVALLHDVGAYRTEEIDRMVAFETEDVWEHSFYGYLFFRELSPLSAYAEVILYHHMPDRLFTDQNPATQFLAQCLFVADRVDVLQASNPGIDAPGIRALLKSSPEGMFSADVLDLFLKADDNYGLIKALRDGSAAKNPLCGESDEHERQQAVACLDMLVHIIDFRSRHTVTHTVTTAWVAHELVKHMLNDEEEAKTVYFSALLHDLGKIGIPLSILEKPGRLEADEMIIMRTHVTLTERIIEGCVDEHIVHMAVRHHEKLDGSGYPRGLKAEELTLPERIVVVADIVSALVGTRSYKEAFPKERVLSILDEQQNKGFIDSEVVRAMTDYYDDIMEQVNLATRPVAKAYQCVQDEYRWLLEQLAEKRGIVSTKQMP